MLKLKIINLLSNGEFGSVYEKFFGIAINVS